MPRLAKRRSYLHKQEAPGRLVVRCGFDTITGTFLFLAVDVLTARRRLLAGEKGNSRNRAGSHTDSAAETLTLNKPRLGALLLWTPRLEGAAVNTSATADAEFFVMTGDM